MIQAISSKLTQTQLAKHLQKLFSQLQQGQHQAVIEQALVLIKSYSKQSDLLHLLALAYKNNQQYSLAIRYFKKALACDGKQVQVHNNLANVYKLIGDNNNAEQHYLTAISYDQGFVEAHKNLALVYLDLQKISKAKKLLEKSLKLKPQDVSILTALANCYKAEQNLVQAIKLYKKALVINPNYINALHNLGVAYKLSEQFEYAQTCFLQAKKLAPNIAEIDYNFANTLFEQGNYNDAEKLYWSALNKDPSSIECHQTLNEFYWQLNKKEKFGQSYKLAIDYLPNKMSLRHAFIDSLISAGQFEQAKKILKQALSISETPQLLALQGRIAANVNQQSQSIDAFERSLKQHYDINVALDLIKILIMVGDYSKAQTYIAQAELIAPMNQLLIAYKGLCWQLTEDERYEWLIDYQRYIVAYDIPVPPEYTSREEFLTDLQQILLAMHSTEHEPLKQTLKNGTQTPGRLFYKPIPQIVALKKSFEIITREFVNSLPSDHSHPLLSRKAQQFNFAGSWSVKLKPNGFHINHVHPEGWLSSCFYINVPDFSKHEQPSEYAGSIKFGESSMDLGKREKIGRIIAPSAGKVAIFPSYVWHGTFPFNGSDSDFRLTAPCDIVPIY
jgi:tetratricopeptide (TPR) repeat protein